MSPDLEAAMARLQAAATTLETAVARHFDVDARRSDLETELQIMQDDRARLALDLEGAGTQLARMNGAVDQAGRRVEGAIAAIQAVLTRAGLDGDEAARA